jgi:hypothetical protein
VSGDLRVKDLSEDDVRKISRVIEEQGRVEGDLRKEVSMNIKRLMEIGPHPEGPAQGRRGEEEDGVTVVSGQSPVSSVGLATVGYWQLTTDNWQLATGN